MGGDFKAAGGDLRVPPPHKLSGIVSSDFHSVMFYFLFFVSISRNNASHKSSVIFWPGLVAHENFDLFFTFAPRGFVCVLLS